MRVLGTGFKPPLKGLALAALEWLKASAAPVLAVDLPSGWPADETGATVACAGFSRRCGGHLYRAQAGARLWPADAGWDQPVVVAPIGSPDEAIVSTLKLDWAGASLALVQAPRRGRGQQGQLRACAGGGRHVGNRGRQVGRSSHGGPGGVAGRRRPGDGRCAGASSGAGGSAVSPELMTWPLAASASGMHCGGESCAGIACCADGTARQCWPSGRGWGRARRR